MRYSSSRAGLPATKLDNVVARLLNLLRKILPKSWQLAHTIALEHYTAMLAGGMLSDPRHMGESEPGYRQVWTWHALEEIEHKSVAFDVYEAVGGGYLQRAVAMVWATLVFAITFGLVRIFLHW